MLQISRELVPEPGGEACGEKRSDNVIRPVVASHTVDELAILHETVVFLGTDNRCARNGDVHVGVDREQLAVLEHHVEEDHPAALAADRSAGELEEILFLGDYRFVEVEDLAPRLLSVDDVTDLDQVPSQFVVRRKIGNRQRLDELRDLDLAPRHQPAREMVAFGVIDQGFVGNSMEEVPELGHRTGLRDFFPRPVAEDEIPESEVVEYERCEIV